MKYLILLLPILAACAPSGGGSASPAVATAPTVVLPIAPTPSPTPQPVSLTYYSITHAVNAVPFTGSCVNYNTNTYCWDDGVKAVGLNHYSFWQVTNPLGRCSGNCASDLMASVPTTLTLNVLAQMTNALAAETPTHVLSNGVPTSVSCGLLNNILSCVDFQIDLNQVSL